MRQNKNDLAIELTAGAVLPQAGPGPAKKPRILNEWFPTRGGAGGAEDVD